MPGVGSKSPRKVTCYMIPHPTPRGPKMLSKLGCISQTNEQTFLWYWWR